MATTNWTGATSTDWFNAANWDNGVPDSTLDVVIGTTVNQPTFASGSGVSLTINSLTINGNDVLNFGSTNTGNSMFLTVTNGITIGAGGGILGQGTLTGDITVNGTATIGVSAVNGQNTPQFTIDGTITDPGNTLTLLIGNDGPSVDNLNADELILFQGGAANQVDFTGGSGQLTLRDTGAGVSLTLASAMAIGAGTLFLDGLDSNGAILTDGSGVTIGTGNILGIGRVQATVNATGAATIATNGGTLGVDGTITDSGGALTLSIANAGDILQITDGGAANSVSFNGAGATLEIFAGASLTVGTQMAIGDGTLQLDGSGATLTDTSGVTISGGTILGAGLVDAAVAASGANSITVTGGTLEITGAITDADNLLGLTITSTSDTLKIDGTSAANSVSFSGASGILLLASSADLTVSTALDLTGDVVLQAGSALHDLGGVSINGGAIIGAGLVDAVVTATGTAEIDASGGTLEIAHQLTDSFGALTLNIIGSSDRLLLDFNSTANAVSFNGNSGTLELNSNGTFGLTVATQLNIGTGTVQLDSALSILTDSNGITLAGGTIIGQGGVDGNITGTGTVRASGGTLELLTAIGNSAGPTYQIADGASNILQVGDDVGDVVGNGNTFDFLGAAGALGLFNDSGFDNTIDGLNVGVAGAMTNFVDIEGHTVTISTVTGQGTTSGVITLSDGAVLHLTGLNLTAWFANAVSDGAGGTNIFVSDTACYCRGTMILTDRGEVAVEDLAIGDRVMTISGAAKPVKWLGHRAYDARFVAGNRAILPIRIAAGALADGVPVRDLWVSPGHALLIAGVLVRSEHLINGATITQEQAVDQLEYFHIELEAHDIIIADGAPAESYLDCDNRGKFHNAGDFARLYPDDARPHWQYCAPLLEWESAQTDAIRAVLIARAEILGHQLDRDPDLHLIVDGALIRPEVVEGRVYRFAIPSGSASVSLASRSVVPAEVEPSTRDQRPLGVPVEYFVLDDGALRIEVEHDHMSLADGFYDDEATHRWTGGLARLPAAWLRVFPAACTLEVHLRQSALPYRAPLVASARVAA